ncbi:T6SS immunity protein Tli4 family protein [Modicisalibacter radicis]|uniref:T6SS immunity protein Tli4 family protein n=1 Tax=Halomonas sp. EAR18 TaxID=2518972 RepID=UPI00109BFE66|nr:T6SS immunity protein Tli4 family protein [Halomonas sp. EAR18]
MITQLRAPLISGLLLLATACGAPEQGVPEMNDQERQTVEAYTETQAPVCIGRFQVDMPSQLAPRFSSLTVNEAKISATPNSRQMFERFIEKRQKALQEHPVDARDAPFLKNIIRHDDIVIFDRNESQGTYDSARTLEGYRFVGLTMFSIEIDAIDLSDEKNSKHRAYLESNKSERLKQVEYLLNHLSPRKAGEIPERPGLCFEHGFLAGGADQAIPGAAVPTRKEQIGMRFSDNKNRDVYIHFYTDSTIAEEDTLLDRTDQAERALANDQNFSVLRKGEVDLDGIDQAEEWLSAGTTDENVKGNYFNLEANSRIGSPGTPYVDISLRNGQFAHDEDHPALDKASLTDAEAVGLWDAITRTFKPRPDAF